MTLDAFLLVVAVGVVGVLHTMVPDHWVPIVLLARQQGWSKAETARASLQASAGHVLTTLVIGLAVWVAGAAFATRFGQIVDFLASLALIGFGAWIGFSSWLELRRGSGHHHHHHGHHDHHDHEKEHDHEHDHDHSQDAVFIANGNSAARNSGKSSRMALLLILGSSPMVEGIPAFFAAGKYGLTVILIMAVVFALSTIVTYVTLCVYSAAGFQRLRLGPLERYGEVLSGAFIALVGLVFLVWPVL
jgi:ABC-type nickel/cobalt efflux system permease component RcnA